MDDFNFELLRIFLVVSKLHSFSRAADYLYVDQSTISKKMRQLEDEFGLILFVRTARGVELTVAGTSFKQRTQQLIDDFEHLREKSPVEWKNLLIGVFDNIAAYCYPGFFARHLAEFKLLKVGNAGVNLIDLFNSGELDIVIVNGSLVKQIKGPYVKQRLAKEGFGVLARAGGIDSRPCTLAELTGKQLLIALDYWPVSQQLLKYRAHFQCLKMVDYTATMIQLIRHSAFQTILPAGMVADLTSHDPGLGSAPLTDLPARQITVFAREQLVLNKVVTALTC